MPTPVASSRKRRATEPVKVDAKDILCTPAVQGRIKRARKGMHKRYNSTCSCHLLPLFRSTCSKPARRRNSLPSPSNHAPVVSDTLQPPAVVPGSPFREECQGDSRQGGSREEGKDGGEQTEQCTSPRSSLSALSESSCDTWPTCILSGLTPGLNTAWPYACVGGHVHQAVQERAQEPGARAAGRAERGARN